MTPAARLIAPLAALLMTGGCVVAAIPIAAGGLIARDQLRDRPADAPPQRPVATAPQPVAKMPEPIDNATAPAPVGQPPARTPAPATGSLVRKAETRGITLLETGRLPEPDGKTGAGAQALGSYAALWTHVSGLLGGRTAGQPLGPVVLAPGATPDQPAHVPCADQPPAVIFDLDENPARSADPEARWRRWRGDPSDNLDATPGAVEVVRRLREAGAPAIFVSARSAASTDAIVATLDRLGLGPVEAGRTLFLRGGVDQPGQGDQIRQHIASRHCVIAIVGDSPADFSDTMDAADAPPRLPSGWFLLPSPIHSIARPAGGK